MTDVPLLEVPVSGLRNFRVEGWFDVRGASGA